MRLFQGFGIEIEYMITDATGNVRPVAHTILSHKGKIDDRLFAHTGWSNELVSHLIELKTNGPKADLDAAARHFQRDVRRINKRIAPLRLMPSGMHPFMNPTVETVIWEYECKEIYQKFHSLFNCHRHGWANLQSVHLNLPFTGDKEFSLLHQAVRIVLPLIPAIAASSPYVEGKKTGLLCNRLAFYAKNSTDFPTISGNIIPEEVHSKEEYEQRILQPMYKEIKPHDADNILQYEWLNARGAIARFDRNAIEIRLIDTQECPQADIAICKAVVFALQHIIGKSHSIDSAYLRSLLVHTTRLGEHAIIDNKKFLSLFDLKKTVSAGELWRQLCTPLHDPFLNHIFKNGTLATRILKQQSIRETYETLCVCLNEGKQL